MASYAKTNGVISLVALSNNPSDRKKKRNEYIASDNYLMGGVFMHSYHENQHKGAQGKER